MSAANIISCAWKYDISVYFSIYWEGFVSADACMIQILFFSRNLKSKQMGHFLGAKTLPSQGT